MITFCSEEVHAIPFGNANANFTRILKYFMCHKIYLLGEKKLGNPPFVKVFVLLKQLNVFLNGSELLSE